MVDAAAASLRTASMSIPPAKSSAKASHPSPALPQPKMPGQEQQQAQDERQHHRSAQKSLRHSISSVQALHSKSALPESQPAAAAAINSATPGAAASDAPYSFRQHRRMDLQPAAQQPGASSGTPVPAVRAGVKTKIKLNTASSAEAPGAAQHTRQKSQDPPTGPRSTRNSIRIKLKRYTSLHTINSTRCKSCIVCPLGQLLLSHMWRNCT